MNSPLLQGLSYAYNGESQAHGDATVTKGDVVVYTGDQYDSHQIISVEGIPTFVAIGSLEDCAPQTL